MVPKQIGVALTTLLLPLIFSTNLLVEGVRPGDYCTANSTCQPATTWMECDLNNYKCGCADPDGSYFLDFPGECHRYVGSSCSVDSTAMPCPLNGGCSAFGGAPTCRCLESAGFFETSHKKCAKELDDTCTTGSQCDQDNFLTCSGSPSTCRCDAYSNFDPITKMCGLSYGEYCQNVAGSQPCSPWQFLTCNSNSQICMCVQGASWDIAGQLCTLSTGGTCKLGDGQTPCDPSKFLVCTGSETQFGVCECATGAVEDPLDGMCVLSLGSKCQNGTGKQPCDSRQLLVCGSEGVCGCADGFEYDQALQSCVEIGPLEGDGCGTNSDCWPDKTFMECVNEMGGLFCHCPLVGDVMTYFERVDKKCHLPHEGVCQQDGPPCPINGGCDPFITPARCECLDGFGYHPTPQMKCAKNYNDPCTSDTDCNRDALVWCLGTPAFCSCDDDHFYDYDLKLCVSSKA